MELSKFERRLVDQIKKKSDTPMIFQILIAGVSLAIVIGFAILEYLGKSKIGLVGGSFLAGTLLGFAKILGHEAIIKKLALRVDELEGKPPSQ